MNASRNSHVKNIVVIGAGQLGSRHLQALAKINFKATIEVVDPFQKSLQVSKKRFEEMPSNPNIQKIQFLSSIDQLSYEVDLAIIATNSDVRATIIRQLLNYCDVKNLLLEKVLFQDIQEYEEIGGLLEAKNIRTWVNHTRRLFPYYEKLAKLIKGSKQVSYDVQGGAWGLASNGLHFIDHLAFLTGCNNLIINTDRLNPIVSKSKRPGFIEINGVLAGIIGQHPFNLFCHPDELPTVITICADNLIAVIDETNGLVKVSLYENEWQWVEERIKVVHFQSELSNKVVEDILIFNRCALPTYLEAKKLHVVFIRALMDHINKYSSNQHTICPIT